MNELAREEAAQAAALRWTVAATQADEAAAKAATHADDWTRGEDRLSDLYGQISRKGLIIEPIGLAHVAGPRAAQQAVLSREGIGRPLGDLFMLLNEGPEGWRVAGATKVRPQVALFLHGQVAAHEGPERLPPDEGALRWAALLLIEQALGGLGERLDLPAELTQAAALGPGVALRSVAVPGAGRSAVELRFGEGDEAWQGWAVLQAADEGLSPIDARKRLRYEPLLRGLELSWPSTEQVEMSVSPALDEAELHARIRATFVSAFAEAEAELGDAPADDPRRLAPQRILKMLDAALAAAPSEAPRAARAVPAPIEAPPAAPPPLSRAVAVADGSPSPEARKSVQNNADNVNPDKPTPAAAPEASATEAGPTATPEADPAAGAEAKPPPRGPVPITLPPRMQEAVGQLFAAAGGAEGGTLDAEFLQAHGGELAGGLLRGFLQEVLPPTLELDVTVPKPSADGQSMGQAPAKVKVDLGSILNGLFKPRPPAATPKPDGEA